MAGFHRSLQAGAMIEGEQHVVDRRAVCHISASLGDGSRRLSSSHETAALSTLRWGGIEPCGAGGCVFSGHWELRLACRNTLFGKRQDPGSGSTGISGSSLLKWLNSPYRPALPEGIRGRLVPPLSRQLIGASPSGKAVDFDSTIRRFESSRPSQPLANKIRHFLNLPDFILTARHGLILMLCFRCVRQ